MAPTRTARSLRRFPPPAARFIPALLGLLMFSAVGGCGTSTATSDEPGYPAVYEQHTQGVSEGDAGQQRQLRNQFADFIAFYASLDTENISGQVQRLYAEDLYFNDTLKTFLRRDNLIVYLQETADRVEYNHVDITSIIPFGDDYFMRWKMSSGFKVFGRMIKAESIGMTHIRLDDEGKVNFHQDFWDNTEGLFQHLPVVGFVVRKTRDRL